MGAEQDDSAITAITAEAGLCSGELNDDSARVEMIATRHF